MEKNRVGMKDILMALRKLPKTVAIIRRVSKKLFFFTIVFSVITGIFPVITLNLISRVD